LGLPGRPRNRSFPVSSGHVDVFIDPDFQDEERFLKPVGCDANRAIQGRYFHITAVIRKESSTRFMNPTSWSAPSAISGCGSSIGTLMRGKSKRLQIGRLSSMVIMMVGLDLKNPCSFTTKLRGWRHPPPAITGAVCPNTGANTLFQALCKQQNMSEVQCPAICAPFQLPRCHAVVVLAITHEEIGTKPFLTGSTTPATEKLRKGIPSHLACSCLINLVILDKQFTSGAIIDRMIWLYAQMHFSTKDSITSQHIPSRSRSRR
jgi:hypothetical protein